MRSVPVCGCAAPLPARRCSSIGIARGTARADGKDPQLARPADFRKNCAGKCAANGPRSGIAFHQLASAPNQPLTLRRGQGLGLPHENRQGLAEGAALLASCRRSAGVPSAGD